MPDPKIDNTQNTATADTTKTERDFEAVLKIKSWAMPQEKEISYDICNGDHTISKTDTVTQYISMDPGIEHLGEVRDGTVVKN